MGRENPRRRGAAGPGPTWLVLLAVSATAPFARALEAPDAVIKVYTTQLAPDYGAPWRAGSAHDLSGSGFVLPGRRILTNAHVVSDASFIQVRRHGEARRVPARVLHVSHDADLALLAVDEPGFFDSIAPLALGGLPELRQEVTVLGFPVGGDTLSVTRGVVSRVEHQTFVHASADLLAGQIDSAVNPGNSGGPVLAGGRVVGVAMQSSSRADNIAYMVPTPVVEQFLADVADGSRDGVPEMPFLWQRMEAADLRRRYGLPPSGDGVLVLGALAGSSAERVVRPADVLLAIDGHAVAADGTIEFRPRERTAFSYLLQTRQLGERVELEILRAGRTLREELRLDRQLGSGRLVSGPLHGERPRYYIFGGLGFCPLTVNYLKAWGEQWWAKSPRHLISLLGRPVRFEGEEPVVICKVLRGEQNSGYEDVEESLVAVVDGRPVRNLRQLAETIESGRTPLLVLETHDGRQIVLDRQRARREGPALLARYQVAADRSEDLAAVGGARRSLVLAAAEP